MYFSALERHAQSQEPLKPVYVAFGNSDYEIMQTVAALKARAGRDGDAAMSIVELGKDERDLAHVMDELQSTPMFVPYRLLVITGADEFINRHRKAVENYLGHPCPSAVLVMTVDKWNKTTRVAKLVEEVGASVGCWLPRTPADLITWLQRRSTSVYQKTLTPGAAGLLADLCQGDPLPLVTELEKLSLYVGAAPRITEDDVAAGAMSYHAYKPFDLADKLAAGNQAAALQVVETLMTEGMPGVVFVGTLRSYVRRLLEAKLTAGAAGAAVAVAKFAYGQKEQESFRRQLERLSAETLVAAYRRLMEADLALKTSRAPEQLVVDRLVLGLFQPAASRVG